MVPDLLGLWHLITGFALSVDTGCEIADCWHRGCYKSCVFFFSYLTLKSGGQVWNLRLLCYPFQTNVITQNKLVFETDVNGSTCVCKDCKLTDLNCDFGMWRFETSSDTILQVKSVWVNRMVQLVRSLLLKITWQEWYHWHVCRIAMKLQMPMVSKLAQIGNSFMLS